MPGMSAACTLGKATGRTSAAHFQRRFHQRKSARQFAFGCPGRAITQRGRASIRTRISASAGEAWLDEICRDLASSGCQVMGKHGPIVH